MSVLGVVHTAISVGALIVAAVCLIKDGMVNPFSKWGKAYSILTALACISAFGLFSKGGFNPGHALAILILILLAISYWLGKRIRPVFTYLVLFCMSTTVFLSLIPGISETLRALPVGHPIADNPASPVILNSLKVLLLLFVTGVTIQFLRQRKALKNLL